jgi:hypothetical protein
MKPFRSSFTARAVTASATFALIAGGLIPVLDLRADVAVPIVLLVGLFASIPALIVGARDYPGACAALAIAMPIGLFAYLFTLYNLIANAPSYGWVLIGLGGVPLAFLIGSWGRQPAEQASWNVSRT